MAEKKKIDFSGETLLIGCIPLHAQAEHPKDQQECIVEKCPLCDKDMWVSKKKRNFRDKAINVRNVKTYCLLCVAKEAIEQNVVSALEMMDITNMVLME